MHRRPPYTRASIAAVRGNEPARLTKSLRGELDWIAMKALEKDRARRYETANGLALDLQRYLNDDHVLACPPSAAYRFGKFAKKHRVAFTTTTLRAVSLLLGSTVSLWQAIRATAAEAQALSNEAKAKSEEQKAITSAQAEATQRKQAERNFEAALESVALLLAISFGTRRAVGMGLEAADQEKIDDFNRSIHAGDAVSELGMRTATRERPQ